mmetsp:Transcript_69591/g.225201  ORF Transcript_69591/g.225201 Transcript_69591/m.225201 type:complete len:355 (-) Transcript_69591:929-1993(-)
MPGGHHAAEEAPDHAEVLRGPALRAAARRGAELPGPRGLRGQGPEEDSQASPQWRAGALRGGRPLGLPWLGPSAAGLLVADRAAGGAAALQGCPHLVRFLPRRGRLHPQGLAWPADRRRPSAHAEHVRRPGQHCEGHHAGALGMLRTAHLRRACPLRLGLRPAARAGQADAGHARERPGRGGHLLDKGKGRGSQDGGGHVQQQDLQAHSSRLHQTAGAAFRRQEPREQGRPQRHPALPALRGRDLRLPQGRSGRLHVPGDSHVEPGPFVLRVLPRRTVLPGHAQGGKAAVLLLLLLPAQGPGGGRPLLPARVLTAPRAGRRRRGGPLGGACGALGDLGEPRPRHLTTGGRASGR